MKKNSLMILMLLLMTACSQTELEVTPQVQSNIKKDIKDINTTAPQVTHTRMEIKREPVVQEEFVPEHIRRSHIEVVEHY